MMNDESFFGPGFERQDAGNQDDECFFILHWKFLVGYWIFGFFRFFGNWPTGAEQLPAESQIQCSWAVGS